MENDFSLLLFLADMDENSTFFEKTHDIILIILIWGYTLPLYTQMACKNIILEKKICEFPEVVSRVFGKHFQVKAGYV